MPLNAQPPSAFLPALNRIKNSPEQDISNAIARLRFIYLPQVRGSTRRRPPRSLVDFHASSHGGPKPSRIDNNLESIRNDAFERSFSIQWLTRFISVYSEFDIQARMGGGDVLEEAASLLAACAGAAASGHIMRTFTFFLPRPGREWDSARDNVLSQSSSRDPSTVGGFKRYSEGDKINVVLRDAPLDSADFSNVGAQTWGGSCVLAEMIVENPETFGIDIFGEMKLGGHPGSQGRPPFRALELGAGTGLGSLVLGKILDRFPAGPWQECRPDTIVATDFHPSVLANLKVNVEANFPPGSTPAFPAHTNHLEMDRVSGTSPALQKSCPQVVVLPLDWSSIHALSCPDGSSDVSPNSDAFIPTGESSSQVHNKVTGRAALSAPPLNAPFDLIIGADIIYERLHARWVRSCVEQLLRKPYAPSAHAHVELTSSFGTALVTQLAAPSIEDTPDTPALFHLIIPLRGTHASESRSVEEVFRTAADVCASLKHSDQPVLPAPATTQKPDLHSIESTCAETNARCHSPESAAACPCAVTKSHGPTLAILSKEDIVCDAYTDRDEAEVVYRYYRIGWV